MKLLLKNGHVVDPVRGINGMTDVLIDGTLIAAIGKDLPVRDAHVWEVPRSCLVVPGLIDMHVHLREPGQEHKETIATGTAAAVAGGFTAVACMPNTDPINDGAAVTRFILQRAAEAGMCRVYPIGAVSVGSKGEQLAELGELHSAGCVAISDDGHPVRSAILMRRALEYAGMFRMPVIDHCEDPSLKGDGVAHEGPNAARLGLRGIPGPAEELMVERDITLAGYVGGTVHIAHMSSGGSLRAVREGKRRNVKVTCEVTPHHFTLTDVALDGYDTNMKMNPPLRETADCEALIAGLADGSIDVIATDHAPHHYDDKQVEFDRAAFGIVGLETAVSLTFDRLVHRNHLSVSRMVELLSVNPAKILGVAGGSLTDGAAADITILSPDLEVTIDPTRFRSKGRNTPFGGWRLRGGVAATMVGGRLLYGNPSVSSITSLIETRQEVVRG